MMSEIRVNTYGSCAFDCAVAETQGHRDAYEDAHEVVFSENSTNMWLLDGHHGAAAAQLSGPALVSELGSAIKGDQLPSRERISQSFRTVDNQLRKALKNHPHDTKAGSTVVGLLASKHGDGYSAKLVNCGDSRGVILKPAAAMGNPDASQNCKNSECFPVIIQSMDHKPDAPEEKARIEAAGGRVCGKRPARIDGKLAVSRGLGDFKFKNDRRYAASAQKVTCIPDIYEVSDLQPGTLAILACDGLWDVMSTEDVAGLVTAEMCSTPDIKLSDIAHHLVSTSLARKSRDNITVMIAQFAEAHQAMKFDKDSDGNAKGGLPMAQGQCREHDCKATNMV
jgi:serine/threonine protein phosphatase PrpC